MSDTEGSRRAQLIALTNGLGQILDAVLPPELAFFLLVIPTNSPNAESVICGTLDREILPQTLIDAIDAVRRLDESEAAGHA